MLLQLWIWFCATIVAVLFICAILGLIPILIEFDIGKLFHFKIKLKGLSSRLWGPKRH